MSVTELTKPQPSRRVRLWAILRDRRWHTRRDLAERMAISSHAVDSSYLTHLTTAGYLECKSCRPAAWRLLCGGAEAPRFSDAGVEITISGASEAIWRTIRIMRGFGLAELRAHVSRYAAACTVNQYVSALLRAGYLRVTRRAHRPSHYQLIKNTGPQPPQILKVKEVYDPNLDAIMTREVPDYDA